MKFNDTTYHKIDLYLNGQLSSDELSLFEKELESNPDLATEVQVQKAINETIVEGHMGQLLDQIDLDFDSKYDASQKAKNTKWILGGIGLVTLTIGSLFFINHSSENEPKKQTVTAKTEITEQVNTIAVEETEEVKQDITPTEIPVAEQEQTLRSEDNSLSIPKEKTTLANTELREVETGTPLPEEKTGEEENPAQAVEKTTEKAKTCPATVQEITIQQEAPSLDQDNGKIIIQGQFTGLSTNVKYRLLSDDDYEDTQEFSELSAGIYSIEAVDDLGCIVTAKTPTQLSATGCSAVKKSVFTTEYDENWELSTDDSRDATFVIKDASGQIVVNKMLYGEPQVDWNGFYENGTEATKGIYYYQLTYSDNEECIGVITLVK